ncbi:hypothetical protein Lal_00010999 [Lupinus albus]|nr:hypothetical protein Lal_00010999 [Lupinus albus]
MPLEKDKEVNDMVVALLESNKVNDFDDYKMHIYFEHPILDIEDTDYVSDLSLIEDSIAKTLGIVEDDNDVEMLTLAEHDVAEENVVDVPEEAAKVTYEEVVDEAAEEPTEKHVEELVEKHVEELIENEESFVEGSSNKKESQRRRNQQRRISQVEGKRRQQQRRKMRQFQSIRQLKWMKEMLKHLLRNMDMHQTVRNAFSAYPIFNEHTSYGHIGIEFANLTLFKNVVKDFNIFLGREVK